MRFLNPGLLAALHALVGQLLVAESSEIKPSEILPVSPGPVPADSGTIGPERVRAPAEAPTTTAKWITNPNTLAPYLQIPADTPPVFLVHASDDRVAGPENSVVLYQALRQAGVSVELHVYARGGHGFGVRASHQPCSTWIDRCADWLSSLGLLRVNHSAAAFPGLPDLPEGDRGIAVRYPGDAGIAADPSVLFHDDFEAGDPWSRWDDVFHRSRINSSTCCRYSAKPGRIGAVGQMIH